MVVDSGLLATEMLLVAFAGGVLGAALGGYAAYGLAGLVITVGEIGRLALGPGGNDLLVENATVNASAANATGGVATGSLGVNATGLIGYGPVLGPHVAFAGGVAAAAFAARKGYLDTGYGYHEAKHVSTALGSRPVVLLVGGVFGVIGYWLAQLSVRFSLPWDPVAASVVASALLHRTVFGYPLIGKLGTDLLDMSPFERGERRNGPATADGGQPAETQATSEQRTGAGATGEQGGTEQGYGQSGPVGRYLVEPWLPHQYRWANVSVLGLAVGIVGGFLAVATGSFALAFGIAAVTLLLPVANVSRAPITHHMAFPAGIAALALPEAEPTVAILVAGAFGLYGALAGELSQRVFYAHADTHFDPPSASILVTTLTIALLDAAGVFTQTVIPTAGIA